MSITIQLQAPTHSGAGSLQPVLLVFYGRSRAESHSAIELHVVNVSSVVPSGTKKPPPFSERACAGHGQGLMIGSRVI
jgi:hypothetical protein